MVPKTLCGFIPSPPLCQSPCASPFSHHSVLCQVLDTWNFLSLLCHVSGFSSLRPQSPPVSLHLLSFLKFHLCCISSITECFPRQDLEGYSSERPSFCKQSYLRQSNDCEAGTAEGTGVCCVMAWEPGGGQGACVHSGRKA